MARMVRREEKDVALNLARGLVLHERTIRARGKASRQYIIMRPIIEEGLIVRLVEDEETDEANSAPGMKYALRAKDIDAGMLEEIAPGVTWLTGRALEKMRRLGQCVQNDPRRGLAPAAGMTRPAIWEDPVQHAPGREQQIREIPNSDSAIAAINAMLDGQHLVRRETHVEKSSGASNRMFWRPMRPNGDEANPGSYRQDMVSMRYTEWSDRPYGFTQDTVDSLCSLLVRVRFDPDDARAGPIYKLDPEVDREELAFVTGWRPIELETDQIYAALPENGIEQSMEEQSDGEGPIDRGMMSIEVRRRENIVAMMQDYMIDSPSSLGPPPRITEISAALTHEILTTRDAEKSKKLIESAMQKALKARSEPTVWDRLWGRLGVRM